MTPVLRYFKNSYHKKNKHRYSVWTGIPPSTTTVHTNVSCTAIQHQQTRCMKHQQMTHESVLFNESVSNSGFQSESINASSTKFNLGIHSSASQNLLMFRNSEYFFSSDRVRKIWHNLIQTLSDPVTVFAKEHHVTTRLPRKQCYIWHWIDFTWRYSVSWQCIDFKRASRNSLGQPEVLLISAYQR